MWFLGGLIHNQECSFLQLPDLASGLLLAARQDYSWHSKCRGRQESYHTLPEKVFNIGNKRVSHSTHVFRKIVQAAILISGYKDLLSGSIIMLYIVFHYTSFLFWSHFHFGVKYMYPYISVLPAFFPVYGCDWKDTLNDDMNRVHIS